MKNMKDFSIIKAGSASFVAFAMVLLALAEPSRLAARSRKKQVILISIDTLRGDHLDAYGYSRETAPNLGKLIKESTYYREAYLNGCWTMPSHVSLLTGTLPSRHGVNMDYSSYRDGMFVKPNSSIRFLSEEFQLRRIHAFKFASLPNELGFGKGFDPDQKDDPFRSSQKLKDLLDKLESLKEKDFFLFIHTWMVHAPYGNTHFLKKETINHQVLHQIDNFRDLPENSLNTFAGLLFTNNLFNLQDCMTLYDSGIHYVDQCIGELIRQAREIGIYNNLMIIVTSDHGEHFSEHFPDQFFNFHGKDYYEEFIKVPLIIKYPGNKKRGNQVDQPSLIDVMPTVLDYFGWDIPAYVQGRSLLRKRAGKEAAYRVAEAIDSKIEKKMIRVQDLKYIVTMEEPAGKLRVNWDKISQRRLFNLKDDPKEMRNLFNNPQYHGLCMDLEDMLRKIIQNSGNNRFATEQTQLLQKTLDQMRTLGYL